MSLQIKRIYNLSLHVDNNPLQILTDNLQYPVTCGHEDILYICINKVMIPRHIINYEDEKSYIPVRVSQAYSKIQLGKDKIDKLDRFGPVIYEYSGHYDYVHEIQYYPLIGKEINKVDFYLDLTNVHSIYDHLNVHSGIAIKCPITIQYTIIQLLAKPEMDRLIHRSIIVDSHSAMETYPDNKTNDFRCHLQKSMDTSHSTGQPYVQLNSVTIPASLDFVKILRDAFIIIIATTELNDNLPDIVDAFPSVLPARPIHDLVTEDGKQYVKIILKVPLFMPADDFLNIQGSFNLIKQIAKRLDKYSITLTEEKNVRIKITNNSMADKIVVRFCPPSLAAAIGHIHRKTTHGTTEQIDFSDDDPIVDEITDYWESTNSVHGYVQKEKKVAYVREVEMVASNTSALPFDIYRLAPSALFIYADFIDETHVHGVKKRLLAVLDTTTAYDNNRKRSMEHLLLPLYNKRPLIAHVNSDELQFMRFTLETSDGKPYPFIQNAENNLCRVNLSFRYQ